jgi:hypothetical protein
MSPRANFFIAAAGAPATHAAPVFVALSANVARIIQIPHLPSGARTAIATLIPILVRSATVLLPQPAVVLVGHRIPAFGMGG